MYKALSLIPVFSLLACTHADKLKLGPSEFHVEVARYSQGPGAKKALLIMPPTGGTNYLDRSYAKKFRAKGYDVYILEKWTGMNEDADDLALHQRLYTRGQQAIEIVLAETKAPYVGLLGTSVGATHAVLAASRLDRIDAVFAIAGGVPIMDIVVESDHKDMRDLKQRRQKRYGFKSDAEYRAALGEAFKLEPVEIGAKSAAKGVAIGLEDTTVPTKYQHQLVEFWKPETIVELKNAHVGAIVKTWAFKDDKILEFFEKHSSR